MSKRKITLCLTVLATFILLAIVTQDLWLDIIALLCCAVLVALSDTALQLLFTDGYQIKGDFECFTKGGGGGGGGSDETCKRHEG